MSLFKNMFRGAARTAAVLVLVCWATALRAEGLRDWTDAETKVQIEARIIDKKPDDSEVQLMMVNGETNWLKTERLIKEDQEYIKKWTKEVNHISARVVASGKGWKMVEVKMVAGTEPLTVKGCWKRGGARRKGYPKIYNLKPGEERTITYKGGNKYIVLALVDGKVVEEESWNSKDDL